MRRRHTVTTLHRLEICSRRGWAGLNPVPYINFSSAYGRTSETLADPVTHFIYNGWPAKSKSVPPGVQPYFPIKDELIVDHGVIPNGLRVVVPETLRKEYLRQLHKGILEWKLQSGDEEKPCIALL